MPLPDTDINEAESLPPALIRFADGASSVSGGVSAMSLLALAATISYEVGARYLFNAPTSWVSEVGGYLLVAIVFLGLAAAQRSGSHIRVELLLEHLPPPRALELQRVANWIGFVFVAFCAWQSAVFTAGEHLNGTRSWGLLATPQWIPQIPMTIGFSLFALALLADGYRLRARPETHRVRFVTFLLALLVLALVGLGRLPAPIGATRLDLGSAAIVSISLAIAFLCNGTRTMLRVAGALAALGITFWMIRTLPMAAAGLALTVAILALLLAGVRIALALGMVGLFGVVFLLPKPQLSALAERGWSSVNLFTLTAVPMFVLMSTLLMRSGVTTRMYDSMVKWFGRVPRRAGPCERRRCRGLCGGIGIEHRHGSNARHGCMPGDDQSRLQRAPGIRRDRCGRDTRHHDPAQHSDDHLRQHGRRANRSALHCRHRPGAPARACLHGRRVRLVGGGSRLCATR